jgi:hypothetical protein
MNLPIAFGSCSQSLMFKMLLPSTDFLFMVVIWEDIECAWREPSP